MNRKNARIVISGTVGIGKTTLIKKLKKHFDSSKEISEKTGKSIYLKLHAEDTKKWGFISQLDYLLTRHQDWLSSESESGIVFYDRHYIDDYLFAKLNYECNNLTTDDFESYMTVFNKFEVVEEEEGKLIDIFILLKTDYETIKKRVNKRARSVELKIGDTYFKKLHKLYYENDETMKLFQKNSKKLIVVDAEKSQDIIFQKVVNILKTEINDKVTI